MKDHKDKKDQEEKEHFKGKKHHPKMGNMMHKRRMFAPHMSGHKMHGPGRMLKHSMGHLKDFDNKEDTISYLELKKKRIKKQKKHMMKEMERMDKISNLISDGIKEVEKMKEYSPEDLKSYFKKAYLKFQHEILDEED